MNEQNPKLEKIMNKVPGGLIISGIMWLIMCILIIAGMYLIKYPHFTYISVIYNGNQNNEHKNELLFTIENTDIGILQSHIKGSRVSLKINEVFSHSRSACREGRITGQPADPRHGARE